MEDDNSFPIISSFPKTIEFPTILSLETRRQARVTGPAICLVWRFITRSLAKKRFFNILKDGWIEKVSSSLQKRVSLLSTFLMNDRENIFTILSITIIFLYHLNFKLSRRGY